jgi:biopolymer transport protein ExbB
MFTLMEQGGIILWLILATGIIAIVVFIERSFHVHRAKIKTDDFIKGIFNIVRRNNIPEALSICDETPGPVACIVRSAILNRNQGRQVVEQAMNTAGLTEIERMERRFGILATIAQVGPLLGLLGTVLGMINIYIVIQQKAPLVHAGQLAAGIWQALLATVAGLVIAIFSYIAYNLLVSKVDAIVLDMERVVGETLSFLTNLEIPLAEKSQNEAKKDS